MAAESSLGKAMRALAEARGLIMQHKPDQAADAVEQATRLLYMAWGEIIQTQHELRR
jgi:hypothetical protein